jgi:hypothetical protein
MFRLYPLGHTLFGVYGDLLASSRSMRYNFGRMGRLGLPPPRREKPDLSSGHGIRNRFDEWISVFGNGVSTIIDQR